MTGKDGNPIEGATVYLKDASFNDVYTAQTDKNGRYAMQVDPGHYPFLAAVKGYADEDPRQDNCLRVEITDRNTLATGQASLYFRIA
ncbi:MAG: carboxypeptidase-like regulatory domain-containing protein [Bacillota bacterium]